MCFKYIIVSSVPVSDRGAEISEGASVFYDEGKQYVLQYVIFH